MSQQPIAHNLNMGNTSRMHWNFLVQPCCKISDELRCNYPRSPSSWSWLGWWHFKLYCGRGSRRTWNQWCLSIAGVALVCRASPTPGPGRSEAPPASESGSVPFIASCQWMCVPLKLICTCASESTVRSQYAALNLLNRYIKSWSWVPRAGPAATVQACPCNFKISWIFENAERDATKRSVLCSYKGITSKSIGNFLILIDKRFKMWSEFRGSRCSHYASAGKTILHWLRQSLKCQSRCARNIICGNWLWEYPVKEQIWIMLS